MYGKYQNIQVDSQNSWNFATNLLTISENVKVNGIEGNLVADELLFDIKTQNLNIASYENNKINANINLKWKKVLEY